MECECGAVIRGERASTSQRVVCTACRREQFVLPRNPRPLPPSVAAESAIETTAQSHSRQAWVTTKGIRDHWRAVTGLASDRLARLLPPRHWFSVPRLLLAPVVVLLGLTLSVYWSRGRREMALAEFDSATAAGRSALDRGDFVQAVERFGAAERAATQLGRDDAAARSAAQWHKEARLWTRLAPDSPDALLAGGPPIDEQAEATLHQRFERDFVGRTVVIDGWLSRPSEADWQPAADADGRRTPRTPLELQWAIVGEGCQLELSLAGVTSFDWVRPGESRRAVFGVELAGLKRAGRDLRRWELLVEPKSSTFLTMIGPLRHHGWLIDESLEALLVEQGKRLGIAR